MNGLPKIQMRWHKNGLFVFSDVYKDGKFWPKYQNWEEYMKVLNQIQMRLQKNQQALTINKHFYCR